MVCRIKPGNDEAGKVHFFLFRVIPAKAGTQNTSLLLYPRNHAR